MSASQMLLSAEPLTQTTTVVREKATLYRNALQVARVADGQEDRTRTIDAPDFIDARFAGISGSRFTR